MQKTFCDRCGNQINRAPGPVDVVLNEAGSQSYTVQIETPGADLCATDIMYVLTHGTMQ